MNTKQNYKRVLLLLNWYLPRLHRGIIDYAREHNWFLDFAHIGYFREIICSWHGDAVITDFDCGLEELKKRHIRIASCTSGESVARYADCIVCADEQEIGKIAINYFLHKGFQNFAICSSKYRRKVFTEILEKTNLCVEVIKLGDLISGNISEVKQQLLSLKRPCALLGENDWIASRIFHLATEAGLRIPDDLAILGVGNDELTCGSTFVPLSSVDTRLYERGQRLAEALDRILDGGPTGEVIHVAPATLVVERQSSALYAVEDREMRKIIHYLTANAGTPLRITDLAKHFHRSESALYRMFMKKIGLSPKQLLLNIRLDLARRLLLDTDQKIFAIAEESGFSTLSAFYEVFRQTYGVPPEQWRKNHR